MYLKTLLWVGSIGFTKWAKWAVAHKKGLKSLLRVWLYLNTWDFSKIPGFLLWPLPASLISSALNTSSFHHQTNASDLTSGFPAPTPFPTQASFLYTLMTTCFYSKHSLYHMDLASYNLTFEVLNITSGPETLGHVVICQSAEAWNRIATADTESLSQSGAWLPRVHTATWCCLMCTKKLYMMSYYPPFYRWIMWWNHKLE